MGLFCHDSDEAQAHAQVTRAEHGAKLSHELVAAAASYEAAKVPTSPGLWNHVAANGKPDSHSQAKEILAAAIGAFVDREAETKGLNLIQKEKAKHDAKKRAEKGLADAGEY